MKSKQEIEHERNMQEIRERREEQERNDALALFISFSQSQHMRKSLRLAEKINDLVFQARHFGLDGTLKAAFAALALVRELDNDLASTIDILKSYNPEED